MNLAPPSEVAILVQWFVIISLGLNVLTVVLLFSIIFERNNNKQYTRNLQKETYELEAKLKSLNSEVFPTQSHQSPLHWRIDRTEHLDD